MNPVCSTSAADELCVAPHTDVDLLAYYGDDGLHAFIGARRGLYYAERLFVWHLL
jgi:hypothetical protein